jgi:hypothetical protein
MAASECILGTLSIPDDMHSSLKENCSLFQELVSHGAYESTVFWYKVPCSLVFQRNVLQNQRVN